MRRCLHLPPLLLLAISCAAPPITTESSQGLVPGHANGLELQAYPAGVVAAFHHQHTFGNHEVGTVRVGWNLTERGDFGEHDDEDGGGPGFGVGWRHYQELGGEGWYWGGRVDLWSMEINWRDKPNRRGESEILVLQPTVEGGYRFRLGASPWMLDLGLAVGAEINVDTDGEDVGEGAILLLGASFLRGSP